MGLTKMTRKFYDDKLLWETYTSWGRAASYKRLREFCVQSGMTNPETGKISQMGVFWAVWRYACRNPEEAYKGYQNLMMEYGLFPTFEQFCREIKAHAFTHKAITMGKKEYKRFMEKYLPNG